MWLAATILNDVAGSARWPLERGRGVPRLHSWAAQNQVLGLASQLLFLYRHSSYLSGDIHILLPKSLGKSRHLEPEILVLQIFVIHRGQFCVNV